MFAESLLEVEIHTASHRPVYPDLLDCPALSGNFIIDFEMA